VKLRAKDEDLRKVIMSQIDPDQLAMARSLPLSAEQASQQNELRRAYATFSKLLAEAEEALTMLKAKITSAGGASGKAPVPTFEAIIRTINKMTTMAEKRSGDIDVLENQMRRLRFGSMGLNGSPGPSRSREGSPFATPQKRGSIFSPDRMRDSVVSTPGSYGMRGTPPRKKLSMFSEEEKKTIRQKEAKRKATLQLLRASLEKSGPNVQRLRDDD
jgi:nucleoporin NUP159